MKKFIYHFFIGLVTSGSMLTSCSVDFLKPDPLSFYEPAKTFSTEEGLQSVLATADRHLRTYWTYYEGRNLSFPISTQYMYSDLAVASKTDATIFCDIADVLTPTNRISNDEYNHLGYFWDETYTGIKSANTIISYVDKVEGLSEQTKNEYLGRAYFHRAFRYLQLVFMFKDVPFVSKIVSGPKTSYYSTSREAILEKMVEDMEFAVQWVPDQKDMEYIGMINKGACRMLLSKLYLSTGQWEKAKEQLDIIINDEGYYLMTNTFGDFVQPFATTPWPITRNVIWDLHRAENKLLPENTEVILGMPNRGIGSTNSFIYFYTMRSLAPLWDTNNIKDPDGVKALGSYARNNKDYRAELDYNRALGRGCALIRPSWYAQTGMWVVNGQMDEGDLRHSTATGNWLDMSLMKVNNPTSKYYGQYLEKSWCSDTIRSWFSYPHYKLYLLDHGAESKTSSTQFNGASSSSEKAGNADWYCYRLAEAYLLRAEAKFYMGDASGAAADVNIIRQRAHCSQMYTTVTIGDIMDERARELYLEEWRYVELSRVSYCLSLSGKPDEWGNVYDVETYDKQEGTDATGGSYWYQRLIHYNGFYNQNPEVNVKGRQYKIDKHNLYIPIPQSAIDANRLGKLRQNYGYNGYDETIPMWETWQEAVSDEEILD